MHLHVCADWQMPQSIDVDRTKTQAMHHISTIQQQPTEQCRKKELRTEFGLHERYSPLFELPMNLYRCMPVPSQWIHHWPSMVLSMMQGVLDRIQTSALFGIGHKFGLDKTVKLSPCVYTNAWRHANSVMLLWVWLTTCIYELYTRTPTTQSGN